MEVFFNKAACLEASQPLFKIAKRFKKTFVQGLCGATAIYICSMEGKLLIIKNINKLNEMAMRMLYDDYVFSFDETLTKVF